MGKLIRYEIRGTYRYILGVLALVLILTTGIYTYMNNMKEGSAFGAIFMGLSVLIIFGTALATFLYIVGSFRKELYDDRGYLTFTLPLTGNQIVGAKLIVALMWFVVLGITVGVYNTIMVLYFSPIEIDTAQFFIMLKTMGIPYREFIAFALTSIIGGITTLILIYLSMALSRVTFRNRRIGGLWFIIFLVLSTFITYSQVKIAHILPYYLDLNTFKIETVGMLNRGFDIAIDSSGVMMDRDMGNALLNIASFIYSILIGILTFLGTGYLIENRIDL
ncbi:MAG: hypothetical protein GX329_00765 [Tissierellia bacterium]|nr:hypothetical protein [Tissierellia bacterium]